MENFLFFGLLICGVTLLLLLSAILWAAMRSRLWPQVLGKVLRTEIYEPSKNRYVPLIEYSYVVEGNNFISKSYDFNLFTTKERRVVEGILDTIRGKETISVYYHPWFPKVSVIVPGMKKTMPVLIIILIAVIIIAFSIYKLRIIT